MMLQVQSDKLENGTKILLAKLLHTEHQLTDTTP